MSVLVPAFIAISESLVVSALDDMVAGISLVEMWWSRKRGTVCVSVVSVRAYRTDETSIAVTYFVHYRDGGLILEVWHTFTFDIN